jgi:hypothetical protein
MNRYLLNFDSRLGDKIIISHKEIIEMVRHQMDCGECNLPRELDDRDLLLLICTRYHIRPISGVMIDDLDIGDYATDGTTVSIVKRCVHGNRYYAYLCKLTKVRDRDDGIETLHIVLDMNDHYVECCS